MLAAEPGSLPTAAPLLPLPRVPGSARPHPPRWPSPARSPAPPPSAPPCRARRSGLRLTSSCCWLQRPPLPGQVERTEGAGGEQSGDSAPATGAPGARAAPALLKFLIPTALVKPPRCSSAEFCSWSQCMPSSVSVTLSFAFLGTPRVCIQSTLHIDVKGSLSQPRPLGLAGYCLPSGRSFLIYRRNIRGLQGTRCQRVLGDPSGAQSPYFSCRDS